jgi:hypothetical protein
MSPQEKFLLKIGRLPGKPKLLGKPKKKKEAKK